jgi:D-alanyl-D-alanine carboxypeptidase
MAQPAVPTGIRRMRGTLGLLCTLLATVTPGSPARAAEGPAPALGARLDGAVTAALQRTGVPSASVAIVQNGALSYTKAYGWAQLAPRRAATPDMRYAIGSISKEFTATALLLLEQRDALSLDDPAGKWVSDLGAASGVSIRALLSHTGGVRDYWPQDYDPPEMLKPVTAQAIIARWAKPALDFPSGSDWQYSNTGYTIAGLIAERAAHQDLFQFLTSEIFRPLGMTSAFDFDAAALPASDATGYTRYALGPLRPAAKEGRGWLFAAGELAMTASDLARWDIALIERRLLSPKGYRELTTAVRRTDGTGTGYGLGLDVGRDAGRRFLRHGGEVGGFVAENLIYPDAGTAIVVLTNEDAVNAAEEIADDLAKILLTESSPATVAADARAEQVFATLQQGHIDPALLTANGRSYFTPQALADYGSSLGPLGKPSEFTLARSGLRGGFVTRVYDVSAGGKKLQVVVRAQPDGLIEQYLVSAK